jgi:hypothetical protein
VSRQHTYVIVPEESNPVEIRDSSRIDRHHRQHTRD